MSWSLRRVTARLTGPPDARPGEAGQQEHASVIDLGPVHHTYRRCMAVPVEGPGCCPAAPGHVMGLACTRGHLMIATLCGTHCDLFAARVPAAMGTCELCADGPARAVTPLRLHQVDDWSSEHPALLELSRDKFWLETL